MFEILVHLHDTVFAIISAQSLISTHFVLIFGFQGFSYLSEVGARGLLNLGKKKEFI